MFWLKLLTSIKKPYLQIMVGFVLDIHTAIVGFILAVASTRN